MIAQVRGRVVSAHPRCVVEVGGLGLELLVPEKDRESLSPDEGEVRFFTYLHVREDRLVLFGFLQRADRELFLRLIEVSGVGPKLALAVLSLHPAERVVAAIQARDVAFLTRLPGLGKKTAERITMELGDKLGDIAAAEAVASGGSSVREEVVMALSSLGMTRGAAESALDRMNWRDDDSMTVEEVVREALRYAGR